MLSRPSALQFFSLSVFFFSAATAQMVPEVALAPTTLPAGAELVRSFDTDRVAVQVVSQPFFGATSAEWATVEVGPASLAFLREKNGGAVLLLGDQPLSLPDAFALGPDGRSAASFGFELSYDRAQALAILAVGAQTFRVPATAAPGPLQVVISAGASAPWSLDTLQITPGPAALAAPAAPGSVASGSPPPAPRPPLPAPRFPLPIPSPPRSPPNRRRWPRPPRCSPRVAPRRPSACSRPAPAARRIPPPGTSRSRADSCGSPSRRPRAARPPPRSPPPGRPSPGSSRPPPAPPRPKTPSPPTPWACAAGSKNVSLATGSPPRPVISSPTNAGPRARRVGKPNALKTPNGNPPSGAGARAAELARSILS